MSGYAEAMARAAEEWAADDIPKAPTLAFGRKCLIRTGGMTFDYEQIDMEVSVPFDDDMEPNEAEITLYNITWDHAARLEKGQTLTVEAGYGDDTGVIFSGVIDRVKTQWNGADRATVIKCVDDVEAKTVESIKYPAGTKASTILRALLEKTGTPIEDFTPVRDKTYGEAEIVDGDLMENIKKYARVCGISVYIIKGKLYARVLSKGDDISFTVSEETGMVGSPEEFEEEQEQDGGESETVHGYNVKLLLQHRIQAASIINLSSLLANGSFRVKSGKHTVSENDFYTEVKVM